MNCLTAAQALNNYNDFCQIISYLFQSSCEYRYDSHCFKCCSKVSFAVHKTVCNIHIVTIVHWAVIEDQFHVAKANLLP